jgi:hypothetical protein
MNIGIGAGDGNTIFEIAAKYQKMQLREMEKNIETIKQTLRSGQDTGSIKFIDEINKIDSLLLQLKVKGGFVVTDDIDDIITAQIQTIINDNIDDIDSIKSGYFDGEGLLIIKNAMSVGAKIKEYKGISDLNTRLIHLFALREHVIEDFPKAKDRVDIESYQFFGDINAEIENIRSRLKAEYGNTMSKDAFDKLNKVSDTIPNIINQILTLVSSNSRLLKSKFITWQTEISGDDLTKLLSINNDMYSNYLLIGKADGVQPYISIYKKIKEPLYEIYRLLKEMGINTGIISSEQNLQNQFKYTNLIDFVNRGQSVPTFGPASIEGELDEDDEDEAEPEALSMTGSGKSYYQHSYAKRFY